MRPSKVCMSYVRGTDAKSAVEVADLVVEVVDASGEVTERGLGAGGDVVESVADAHAEACGDQVAVGPVSKLLAKIDRGGDDQGFELVACRAAGHDCASANVRVESTDWIRSPSRSGSTLPR